MTVGNCYYCSDYDYNASMDIKCVSKHAAWLKTP